MEAAASHLQALIPRKVKAPCDASLDKVPRKETLDVWGRPFKLSCDHQSGQLRMTRTLTSAGPDGKLGTADDVPISQDWCLHGAEWRRWRHCQPGDYF